MAEGYLDFVAGTGLGAAQIEEYCELQSIMRFANAAARDSALALVKTEGMVTYLKDVDRFTWYDGAAWRGIKSVEFGPGTPNAPGTTSGTTRALICSLAVPAQPVAGVLKVWGLAALTGASTVADGFDIALNDGTADIAIITANIVNGGRLTGSPVARIPLAAGAAVTVNLYVSRTAGTGTINWSSDPRTNRIEAIFVPT